MNFNELRQNQNAVGASSGMTLKDLLGKKSILPLPSGLHECTLKDITSTPTSRALRIIVTDSEDQKNYSVSINIGNTPEQADIFLSIISHLLEQLDLDDFDLDLLKGKIGSTVMILGIEKTSERGTFTNYSFNPAVMLNYLD